MLDAAWDAHLFAAGVPREEFLDDRLRQMGVRMALRIVGEAARNVSEQTRVHLPGAPWAGIVGMRHHLIHPYWENNLAIVWDVVQRDRPALIAALEPVVPPSDEQRWRHHDPAATT
jgi:uncharacterized protein with HEPN domain